MCRVTALRLGLVQPDPQPRRIVEAAQIEDPVQVNPKVRQTADPSSRRYKLPVVAKVRPVIQCQRALVRIHPDHTDAKPKVDVLLGPPFGELNLEILRLGFPQDEFFRQRRTFVRMMRLVQNKDKPTVVPLAPQGAGGGSGGHAAPDQHDGLQRGHAPT
ncbi:hypothetical protein [Loktanella sp. IMCC34160]|uniref:hypothetical protein n=1 Tax=Loktanella sp. IMCC34160 TaxID=2510646 RepID=UPI001F5D4A25|nr:hypothetical protein [Loktanella sp. IMCC34160]